jgi:hypothetical protein
MVGALQMVKMKTQAIIFHNNFINILISETFYYKSASWDVSLW